VQGAGKELRAMETYKRQKNRYRYNCFCSATILTSKIIKEFIESILNFLGGEKLQYICFNFQFDFDKPWSYPWYCYEKAPLPPLAPFWKVWEATLPLSGVPTPQLSYLSLLLLKRQKTFFIFNNMAWSVTLNPIPANLVLDWRFRLTWQPFLTSCVVMQNSIW